MKHFSRLPQASWNRLLLPVSAAILALSLAACRGSAPAAPLIAAPTAASASLAPAAATPAPVSTGGQTSLPSSPPAADPVERPFVEQTSGSLTVRLFATEDMTAAAPSYTLEGLAPAGTVVSVNQAILVVGETAAFAVEVPLEEGPNLVEVTASSPAGDEVSFLLTVDFEPSPLPS
jgi:hypothetical protein